MSNIYTDHLKQLRNIKTGSIPAVSLYVPLKSNDYVPSKIFLALIKVANGLMVKAGHSSLGIMTPEWDRWMKQGTVTLGIFYHNGITKLIPLPTRMQPRVVVAKSFHIKPVVTASNEYVDSLLLHFNESGASLYRVNLLKETLIGSYVPSKEHPGIGWPSILCKKSLADFLEFLQKTTKGSIQSSTKILGVTGASFTELQSDSFWKKIELPVAFLDDSFRLAVPHNAFSIMRLRLAQIVNERHTDSVEKALGGENPGQGFFLVKNLAPKVLKKEIKQLCVSLDCMHFGEIEAETGNIKLNKSQLNASDDDLLDDLLELAIDNGVQVSVVPKKYLPEGRSFVAS
jgi:hypothetical protein